MPSDAVRFRSFCTIQLRRGNRTWVEGLRDRAADMIAAGGGMIGEVQNGAMAGDSFAIRIDLDCIEVAEIAQSALDEFDGLGTGSTGFTVPDFSGRPAFGFPPGSCPDPFNV